jgi:hypothetical protein
LHIDTTNERQKADKIDLKDLVEIELNKFNNTREKDMKSTNDEFPLYSLNIKSRGKRPKSISFYDWRGQVSVRNNTADRK